MIYASVLAIFCAFLIVDAQDHGAPAVTSVNDTTVHAAAPAPSSNSSQGTNNTMMSMADHDHADTGATTGAPKAVNAVTQVMVTGGLQQSNGSATTAKDANSGSSATKAPEGGSATAAPAAAQAAPSTTKKPNSAGRSTVSQFLLSIPLLTSVLLFARFIE